ncbi:transcription termination/antitermination protein NusG [soil metagenome]
MSEIRWYAVETFGNAEYHAHSGLERLNIASWLPHYITGVRYGRYQLGRVKPHFPGYLFAGLAANQSIRAVKDVVGVKSIISSGDKPAVIPPEIIAELRESLADFDRAPLRTPAAIVTFKEGDEVKVVDGPFASFLGEIARVVSPKRISVWVSLFGRETLITLPPAALQPSVRSSAKH